MNSTYNIVVGRSRKVTGPYIDNVGRDMFHGGGKMVIAAGDRVVGPGHFGRLVVADGVEVMSCHYEADFDQGGRSVLGIRPLLWKNDWPVAGRKLKSGTYALLAERRGYSLEMAVDFVRMKQDRQAWWNIKPEDPVKPIPNQTLEEVQSTWPEGEVRLRCGDFMFRPHQLWTVCPVPEAGGAITGCFCKIMIAGTNRALTATADLEVVVRPFEGQNNQLWQVEQAVDGTYRIMPYFIPGQQERNTRYVLYSAGDSTPTLAEWDFSSDNAKWNLMLNE